MTTYSDVKAQIAKLEKQAADLFKKDVAGMIAKVRALIEKYGLAAADLGLAAETTPPKKASTKPAGVAKYRDPVTGKTWTATARHRGLSPKGSPQENLRMTS